MTQSEKEQVLGSLHELERFVQGIPCRENTLFDKVEGIPATQTSPEVQVQPASGNKARRARTRHTDGSMTAPSLANRLTKALGRPITSAKVIKVGQQIGAKKSYNMTQHESRYTAAAVEDIIKIFLTFSEL